MIIKHNIYLVTLIAMRDGLRITKNSGNSFYNLNLTHIFEEKKVRLYIYCQT